MGLRNYKSSGSSGYREVPTYRMIDMVRRVREEPGQRRSYYISVACHFNRNRYAIGYRVIAQCVNRGMLRLEEHLDIFGRKMILVYPV